MFNLYHTGPPVNKELSSTFLEFCIYLCDKVEILQVDYLQITTACDKLTEL